MTAQELNDHIKLATEHAELLEALKEVVFADSNGDLLRKLESINLAKQVLANVRHD